MRRLYIWLPGELRASKRPGTFLISTLDMTVPVREQGNRSRKIVGERRGGEEGVGVIKEVMNGEGFRAGDGKWSIVRDHSFTFVRRQSCQARHMLHITSMKCSCTCH